MVDHFPRPLAVALAAILLAAAAPVATAGPSNASFESCPGCTSNAGQMPSGWSGYWWGSAGTGWSTDAARTGSASLRMADAAGTATGAYSPTFSVAGGATYTASFWSKGATTAGSSLYVYFYDGAGTQVGFGWNGAYPNLISWTQVSVTMTSPSTATQACILVYADVASTGTSYVDDVAMTLGGGGSPSLGGGGTGGCAVSASAPDAPTGLIATSNPLSGTVDLVWQAPTTGGPAYTYSVYRGTSSGSETFLASAGASLSYTDAGCPLLSTCYYFVTGVNTVGEGPASNEASAPGFSTGAPPPDGGDESRPRFLIGAFRTGDLP